MKILETSIKYEYSDFIRDAVKISGKVVMGNNQSKVGLLGICRGGLPLLTAVANFMSPKEVKDVYTISIDSDTNTISHADLGEKRFFIAFDDVVSTGGTIRAVGDYLRAHNAELLEVYCLFRDTDVSLCTGTEIYAQNDKVSSQWVDFPWERNFYNDDV